MSGPDDIVRAIETAEILAFPRGKGGGEGGGDGPPRPPAEEEDALDRRLARFPHTDLGNAERFVERFRGRLAHCRAIGWLCFDGKRWSAELGATELGLAMQGVARLIQREAQAIEGTSADVDILGANGKSSKLSQALRRHGRASEGARRLAAIATLAAPMLDVPVRELDKDAMKFNVQNGTLHFDQKYSGYVKLLPHNPNDYITKISQVEYDPEAACPVFDRFTYEVQPDIDTRLFLQQWAGLSLTGDTREQKLVFFYGKGRNGKSVWVNTLRYIAGDYGDAIPIESFLDSGRARAGGQPTPDIAALAGVRCLTTTEPEKGSKLAEGLVKQLTGGDAIKARYLNRDYFEFFPQFKLTMSGNYRPQIGGTDAGLWDRLILLPWPVYIPPARRDALLATKLRAEASGILNRFLDGLRLWFERGLVIPGSAAEATAEYREDSDPLGRFLAACTEQAIGERVQSAELHRLFCAWAKANGEREWSPTGFGRAMRDRGVASSKDSVVYWLDLRLTRSVDDFRARHDEPSPPAYDSEPPYP
jgi:putative DNA primase/helicase